MYVHFYFVSVSIIARYTHKIIISFLLLAFERHLTKWIIYFHSYSKIFYFSYLICSSWHERGIKRVEFLASSRIYKNCFWMARRFLFACFRPQKSVFWPKNINHFSIWYFIVIQEFILIILYLDAIIISTFNGCFQFHCWNLDVKPPFRTFWENSIKILILYSILLMKFYWYTVSVLTVIVYFSLVTKESTG